MPNARIPARPARRPLALLALVPVAALLAACGGNSAADTGAAGDGRAEELRLGYFANVTHAAALIGVQEGYLADELGETALTTQVFNAGPDEVEALFAGALDAAYIGPSPTVNAYGQSNGAAIRIIAGAASGGAQLVVREGIDGPEDLEGATLASPQLGNTQDVALRTWLTEQGLENGEYYVLSVTLPLRAPAGGGRVPPGGGGAGRRAARGRGRAARRAAAARSPDGLAAPRPAPRARRR
jgi:NitT/TauT family transport system substrate-binding protein